jgi:hypothetical protein
VREAMDARDTNPGKLSALGAPCPFPALIRSERIRSCREPGSPLMPVPGRSRATTYRVWTLAMGPRPLGPVSRRCARSRRPGTRSEGMSRRPSAPVR